MLSRRLLLTLGLLAVLASALLAVLWFRQSSGPSEAAVKPAQTRSILVATHALKIGDLLRSGDMTWAEKPMSKGTDSDIVKGSVAETEYIGAVTKRSFSAQEALTASALVKPGDRDFLIAALSPGFRAVSIAVDAAQSTSGLIQPDDYVDIILTQNFSIQGTDAGHKAVGETVLSDLRVIAVDQTLTPITKAAASASTLSDIKIPKTITLEVTERQAAALLVAEQLGKIVLTLRGQQDQSAAAAAIARPIPPTWASDVSPALEGPQSAKSDGSPSAISVIHGAKIDRFCPASTGLVPCP